MSKIKFLILGFIFGVILIKAEVISWFRIQEMFHYNYHFEMKNVTTAKDIGYTDRVCICSGTGLTSGFLSKTGGVCF